MSGNRMQGIIKMQDPLRYGQMEVFRLGYLEHPVY